jgi:hypothetical protein
MSTNTDIRTIVSCGREAQGSLGKGDTSESPLYKISKLRDACWNQGRETIGVESHVAATGRDGLAIAVTGRDGLAIASSASTAIRCFSKAFNRYDRSTITVYERVGVQICDPEDDPRTDYIVMRRGAFKIDQRNPSSLKVSVLPDRCPRMRSDPVILN